MKNFDMYDIWDSQKKKLLGKNMEGKTFYIKQDDLLKFDLNINHWLFKQIEKATEEKSLPQSDISTYYDNKWIVKVDLKMENRKWELTVTAAPTKEKLSNSFIVMTKEPEKSDLSSYVDYVLRKQGRTKDVDKMLYHFFFTHRLNFSEEKIKKFENENKTIIDGKIEYDEPCFPKDTGKSIVYHFVNGVQIIINKEEEPK